MKDLQLAVRGSRASSSQPLSVFSCCRPRRSVERRHQPERRRLRELGIPIELIAMPLSGFMAPVTLVGTLIQHTAETLSGIVISQLTRPGAPVLYGGSPAIFDLRYETTRWVRSRP